MSPLNQTQNVPHREIINSHARAALSAVRKPENMLVARTIFSQMGTGLYGAHIYIGAHPKQYTAFPCILSLMSPEQSASSYLVVGAPITPCGGLFFRPNTIATTMMAISLEPTDTYTLRMMKVLPQNGARPRKDWYWRFMYLLENAWGPLARRAELLYEIEGIYCDSLENTVKSMYDQYLRDFQHGVCRI